MDREFGMVVSKEEREEAIKKLKDTINKSPSDAIQLLKEKPIYVLVLPKVKLQLEDLEPAKSTQFKELLELELDRIFVPVDSIEENGLAFTLELLIEKWRRMFSGNEMVNAKIFFDQAIEYLSDQIDRTDDSTDNKIVIEILNDFRYRIKSLNQYERKQFREMWESMSEKITLGIREIVNSTINLKSIPDDLNFLLQIATMSPSTALEFRAQLSKILAKEIRSAFGFETEEMKYELAPWIGILEHNAVLVEDELKDEELTATDLKEVEKKDVQNDDHYN